MNDLPERLQSCFAIVFPELSPAEIEGASMATLRSWESVMTLTLIALVEDEFGLSIEPEEAVELTSFPRFLAYVQARANGA
jgi:acyl carrier protein